MTVEKVGLAYRLTDDGASLSLSHVHEHRAGVFGEFCARVDGRVLTRARINISSTTARNSTVRALREVAKNGENSVNWSDLVNQLAVGVLESAHAPAEIYAIGTQPSRPSPPRLLDPLMPEGAPTVLFGPGGAGKSTVAAAIAVSIASGVEIVRGWKPRKTGVAILDYEANESEVNDRIRAIAVGASITPPAVFYSPARRPLADLVEELSTPLDELGVGLLIVDSVGLASGTTRDGGDAAETALRLFGALRILRRSSLLIDHVKGDDLSNDRASPRPYGSVFKLNLARAVFELRREEAPAPGGAQMALLHRKANDASLLPAMGLRLAYRDSQIRIERCEVTAPDLEHRALTTADRMSRLLAANGAMTTVELADTLGVGSGAVRVLLGRDRRFVRLDSRRIGLAAR